MPGPTLVEGIDYTVGPDGLLVFTAHYLKARGYCCGNGCRHCPYPREQKPARPRTTVDGPPAKTPGFEKSPADK